MRSACPLLILILLVSVGIWRSEAQPPQMRDFLASRNTVGTVYLQPGQIVPGRAEKASLASLAENLHNLVGSGTMLRIEGYAAGDGKDPAETALLRAKEVADRLRETSTQLPELTLTGFDARTIPGLTKREKDRVDIVIYDTVLNIHEADVETIISR